MGRTIGVNEIPASARAPPRGGGVVTARKRIRGRAASAGLHLKLLAAAVTAVFPVVWIVLTSIKPRGTWQTTTVELFNTPTPANYAEVLSSEVFGLWFLNSVLVSAVTTAIAVFIAATTGYAVSRFRFPGMRPLMWSLLIIQMFPVAVLIVPIYNLGGLVITYLTFAVPFCAWMLKGYFDTIPIGIDEAGRVDGLSPFGTFWRLVVPLARPGIAVAAFYAFITAWGEVAFATAFMTGDEHYTLAVGLQQYVGQHKAEWGLLTAASVIISVPATAVFLLVQRNLVTGLTAGGTKQ
ncbi:MAG: ABC transporter permease subunit [Streptosporangiales bacterium]|nr:ABC transporter permease subunit [Streptosporangiales bacterium]